MSYLMSNTDINRISEDDRILIEK